MRKNANDIIYIVLGAEPTHERDFIPYHNAQYWPLGVWTDEGDAVKQAVEYCKKVWGVTLDPENPKDVDRLFAVKPWPGELTMARITTERFNSPTWDYCELESMVGRWPDRAAYLREYHGGKDD